MGFLFRGRNPDGSNEERFFAGIEAPLNYPSWQPETVLHVIAVDEGKALEHRMNTATSPGPGSSSACRTCAATTSSTWKGYERVVLARRWDDDRVVLGEQRFPLDPTRYHHLTAEVWGDRVRCWCDGELLADVRDATCEAGPAARSGPRCSPEPPVADDEEGGGYRHRRSVDGSARGELGLGEAAVDADLYGDLQMRAVFVSSG